MNRPKRRSTDDVALFLPRLYPDEIIHSFVARVRLLHAWSTTETRAKLFGTAHEAPGSVSLATRLGDLSARFEGPHPTAEDLAWNHTMLPFITAYRSSSTRRKLLDAMTRRTGSIDGHTNYSPLFTPEYWRFCRLCHKEMLEEYGELYWQRSHQVWIATFCIKHDAPLRVSNVEFAMEQSYTAASQDNCPADAPVQIDGIPDLDISMLKSLSAEVGRLLANGNLSRNRQLSPHSIKQLLFKKGYCSGESFLSWTTMQSPLAAKINGISGLYPGLVNGRLVERADKWMPRLIRGDFKPRTEYIMLAMQIANSAPTRHNFGDGPWPCRSPVCRDKDELVINEWNKLTREGSGYRAYFECSCGYVYTISERGDGSHRKPLFNKFGPRLTDVVVRAKSLGLSAQETAASLGFNMKTFNLALKKEEIERY